MEISFDQKFEGSAVEIPLHWRLLLILLRVADNKQIDKFLNFETGECDFLDRVEDSSDGSVFLAGCDVVEGGDRRDDLPAYELR